MNIDKVIKKESDKKLFHLLYRMPEDNSLFYTDDISYIVGIHKNLSWIWTKENISLENIKEIVKILKNKNIKEITCKNELYITIRKLLEIKNINKINFYECTNINNKKRFNHQLKSICFIYLHNLLKLHTTKDHDYTLKK